jgi:DNA-binding GntR family transcriptional regulator
MNDAVLEFRTTSLHDSVAARLRSHIFDGVIAPGTWIDEKALAAGWAISRTPLREALKVLAAEGLVELIPHRGCRVVELTHDDALSLFPVMALLEGECAREAVLKLDAEALLDLRALHEKLEACAAVEDLDGYYRHNHSFHSRVQQLAGNRWLDRVTGDLRQFIRLMRGRQLQLPGRLQQSLGEHRQLMLAFEARDAQAAEQVMRGHLQAQLGAWIALHAKAPAAAPAAAAHLSGDAR